MAATESTIWGTLYLLPGLPKSPGNSTPGNCELRAAASTAPSVTKRPFVAG